jgi:hypothetical protein
MPSPTARTLLCSACGCPLALAQLSPSVRCPSCGHIQDVSGERRAELALYESNVGRALDRAANEQGQADAWKALSGASIRPVLLQVIICLAVLSVVIVARVGTSVLVANDPSLAWVAEPAVNVATALLIAGGIVAVAVLTYRQGPRAAATLAPRPNVATCPRCGAGNAIALGRALDRCAQCGAALLPSPTIMAQGVATADALSRRAALERFRAERTGMLRVFGMSAALVIPYIAVGPFVGMMLVATLGATLEAITGTRIFSSGPPPATGDGQPNLVVLWLMVAVFAAIPLGVYARRRILRARAARVVASASAPFAHRPIRDVAEMVEWLNANWAGPTPYTEISAGPSFEGAAIVVEHFPGAIALNPLRFAASRGGSPGYPGYVTVHLAAWVPAVHSSAPFDWRIIEGHQRALGALGFELAVDTGGVRAYGHEAIARRLLKAPDGSDALRRVASILLDTARALRAAPPAA